MKQYYLENCRVNGYVAVCTSSAGNVCKSVTLSAENGRIFHAKTALNSSAGYDVINAKLLNKRINITYHVTKRNNIIIDYVTGV